MEGHDDTTEFWVQIRHHYTSGLRVVSSGHIGILLLSSEYLDFNGTVYASAAESGCLQQLSRGTVLVLLVRNYLTRG
jgi:hypothetical protein